MKDIMVFVAVIAGWIVLNMWVLPYFGIRTCMSGACRVPEMKPTELRSTVETTAREESAHLDGIQK
jgi:hypothetical protein